MESEVQKQAQQMIVYWEQNARGFQAKVSNTKVENENYVKQKPHMWCNEEKEQMKNCKVNIILILELQITNKSLNNNYINEGSKI